MRSKLFTIAIIGLMLSACSEAPLFDESVSFDNSEWSQDVKPKYSLEINDTDKEYNFTLSLRTTTDYKYSNLWVFMKTVTPEGIVSRVPYQFRITNEDGSWIGNKTGTIVETPMSFPKRKLPQKGKYTFIIEQGITEKSIKEVLDLTLRVEESKEG